MAFPFLPILAAIAGLAIASSKKKGNGDDAGGGFHPSDAEPGGGDDGNGEGKPIPSKARPKGTKEERPDAPDNLYEDFDDLYPIPVAKCWRRLGRHSSLLQVKTCVFEEVFPSAYWPPTGSAQQWQRNAWFGDVGKELDSYIENARPHSGEKEQAT